LGHNLQILLQFYSERIEAYSGKKDMSRFDGVNTKTGTKQGYKLNLPVNQKIK
jgi:hypothetical protein